MTLILLHIISTILKLLVGTYPGSIESLLKVQNSLQLINNL